MPPKGNRSCRDFNGPSLPSLMNDRLRSLSRNSNAHRIYLRLESLSPQPRKVRPDGPPLSQHYRHVLALRELRHRTNAGPRFSSPPARPRGHITLHSNPRPPQPNSPEKHQRVAVVNTSLVSMEELAEQPLKKPELHLLRRQILCRDPLPQPNLAAEIPSSSSASSPARRYPIPYRRRVPSGNIRYGEPFCPGPVGNCYSPLRSRRRLVSGSGPRKNLVSIRPVSRNDAGSRTVAGQNVVEEKKRIRITINVEAVRRQVISSNRMKPGVCFDEEDEVEI